MSRGDSSDEAESDTRRACSGEKSASTADTRRSKTSKHASVTSYMAVAAFWCSSSSFSVRGSPLAGADSRPAPCIGDKTLWGRGCLNQLLLIDLDSRREVVEAWVARCNVSCGCLPTRDRRYAGREPEIWAGGQLGWRTLLARLVQPILGVMILKLACEHIALQTVNKNAGFSCTCRLRLKSLAIGS